MVYPCRRIGKRVPSPQAVAPWMASMTAAVTSAVLACPPRSGVWQRWSAVTRSIASIRRSPAAVSPRCSSIITADQNVPIGLAMPLPMMSNAEPWIGSNIAGETGSGFGLGGGAVRGGPPPSGAGAAQIMVAGGRDADRARQCGGEVGQDVGVQVGGHDRVERLRPHDHAHRHG